MTVRENFSEESEQGKLCSFTEFDWGFYICIEKDAYVDRALLIPMIERMTTLMLETGKECFLIHSKATRRASSPFELVEYTEYLKQQKHGLVPKFAVISPDFMKSANLPFVDDLAYNRGIELKFFSDKDEAISWLKNEH